MLPDILGINFMAFDAHSDTFTLEMLISIEIISLIQGYQIFTTLSFASNPTISCCVVMKNIMLLLDQIIPQHASLT